MKNSRIGMGALAVASMWMVTGEAHADPTLRVQVSQRGDFLLIGNTLAHNCQMGLPAPVVGAVGACGSNIGDTAVDVFWRADSPNDGEAEANTGITNADARSTAVLELPAGAEVTHAYLFWSGSLGVPGTDPQVTLERPGEAVFDLDAGLDCAVSALNNAYQCAADITAQVQAHKSGPYRVGGVETLDLDGLANEGVYSAWWMVVLYAQPDEPLRNLAVFDGLDTVNLNSSIDVVLAGFLVPDGGYDGKLGVIAYEGDNANPNDSMSFNGGAPLSDAVNPAANFFNSSRAYLGVPVSVAGDLPQYTGGIASMSGIDLDVVDVTAKLTPGLTQATVKASSGTDGYLLGGFVTSVSDYRPDFTTSTKMVVDVNGGETLAGDELEYTIHVVNTGDDTAVDVVLSDPLPAGVTFVPGSLEVSTGPNMGAKTDAKDDDQGEYDSDANVITFRLGMNADDVDGGIIPIDESTDVKFRVTIDQDATGTISNQATINAAGEMGAPSVPTPTDGDAGQGSLPTDIDVDACETAEQCVTPGLGVCDTDQQPSVCVGCLADDQCADDTPTCDLESHTCVCVPSGPEVCDGIDNDCNEAVDDECSCTEDSQCGGADSGKACDDGACVDGCHASGNGCPGGSSCSARSDELGVCVPDGGSEESGGESSDSAPTDPSGTGGTGSGTGGDDSTPTEGGVTVGGETGDGTGTGGETDDATTDGGQTGEEGGCGCAVQEPRAGLLLLGLIGLGLGRRRRGAR